MKKIAIIIGARPQFIKHAALEIALREDFNVITIHTGQHYDKNMSDIFFNELSIAQPTHMLNIRSGDHGDQTGRMMIKIEEILKVEIPDMVIVYGDTNSTLAGALVASKLDIPVAHVEAGLRSFNKAMPEEINRILTDHVSNILFCPTETALNNLKQENIVVNCHIVGDVMVDMIRIAKENNVLSNTSIEPYYFCTIHRPYNTDNAKQLLSIINALNALKFRVKFLVHPRTLNKLKDNEINLNNYQNIDFLNPMSYFECLQLQNDSILIITDSGGIQKEAYLLNKMCITIRSETEWVETINARWNTLVFDELDTLSEVVKLEKPKEHPDFYGDGYASYRIKEILQTLI
ncbi:non-hydrolyzing UDP-N-acetylglucosamine 2-epimerase [Haliscomenobacter sp.]|uniref:non-hydrolyzing UDP-N-acetylglucosamine 2-epimerase n=1 Tax=Haliscomenobacter sp. TaxID=2717303 RepID=UPI003BA84A28